MRKVMNSRTYVRAGVLGLALLSLLGGASFSATVTETANNPGAESALQTGSYTQAQSLFQTFLQNAAKGSSNELYGRIGLGESLLWQGKVADATKEFKRAQALQSKISDAKLQARLDDDLAWLYEAQGNLPAALAVSEQALAALRTLPPPNFSTVESMIHTAYIADLLGQLDRSAQLYKEAIDNIPQGKAVLLKAEVQQRLAAVLWRLGQGDVARQLYEQGLTTQLQMYAPLRAYQPHPYWDNVIFRYQAGAPNTSRRAVGAQDREVIWANGVTIELAPPVPSDDGKAMRMDIAIKNDTDRPIQFLSKQPSVIMLAPKAGLAQLIDPEQLASNIERKGERKAKWIRFWGEDATMPVTSTYVEPQRLYQWGYPPYPYGGMPPIVSSGFNAPVITRNGNITTVTQQVPDYAAQARALAKAADAIEQSQQKAQAIRARSIGPTTVAPGAVASGSLYLDAKAINKSVVRLPVGNAIFEFEFPPRT